MMKGLHLSGYYEVSSGVHQMIQQDRYKWLDEVLNIKNILL